MCTRGTPSNATTCETLLTRLNAMPSIRDIYDYLTSTEDLGEEPRPEKRDLKSFKQFPRKEEEVFDDISEIILKWTILCTSTRLVCLNPPRDPGEHKRPDNTCVPVYGLDNYIQFRLEYSSMQKETKYCNSKKEYINESASQCKYRTCHFQ